MFFMRNKAYYLLLLIGTCASWATEPELCDVCVVFVERIDRIVFTFILSEAGYNFEHLICFAH